MVRKKTIAKRKFSDKRKVPNKKVAEELDCGTTGTEQYMKPLGFREDWEERTDSTGQSYLVKVWIQ